MNWYLTVLKRYAVFEGRARRTEYWYFFLFNLIISLVLAVADRAIGMQVLRPVYALAVLLPSIGVGIRRMHDVGKSGWFILVPIYNLVLACTDGVAGENEYGPDPKAEAEPQA